MHTEIPSGLLLLITILYFTFVFQLWSQVKRKSYKNKDTRAVTALMIVFVFCAISGYASNFIPMPDWMLLASHTILAVITAYMVFTNQSGHIADTLNRDIDEEDIYRRATDKRTIIFNDKERNEQ